jgi:hypothetical protein
MRDLVRHVSSCSINYARFPAGESADTFLAVIYQQHCNSAVRMLQ